MPVGSGEGFYISFLSRLEEKNHVGAGEERAERCEWEWKLDVSFLSLQADEYDVLLTLWTVPLTKEAFGEQ